MIVERAVHQEWLTNTYLVASGDGEDGLLVDAGGPIAPLLQVASARDITLTHVLVTHRHEDHVAELDAVIDARPNIAVMGHPEELRDVAFASTSLLGGERITVGGLEVQVLHTPGHTAGMLAYWTGGAVFTADTLYRGSVGAIRSPGHTTFGDLRRSVLDVLLTLPEETVIYPGHADATSVAHERATNPFVRAWTGLDPERQTPCMVAGDPAQALVIADDYDGGTKVWVRFAAGAEDVVPGSITVFDGEQPSR